MRRIGLVLAAFLALCAPAPGRTPDTQYDLVLSNGRVIDPESRLHAIRDVGILDGRIAAISSETLHGAEVVDVGGLVVAPGFIDLHAHGQDPKSSRYQAADGVTTALELEGGAYPVARWYEAREGRSLIHYGASVGHMHGRMKLKHDFEMAPTLGERDLEAPARLREWAYERTTSAELTRILALLEAGLDEGALGVGLGLAYTPGAERDEIFRVFQLAAERGATLFVHLRSAGGVEPGSSIAAVQEVIADAAASGASLHLVHITSSGLRQTGVLLEMIEGARRSGLDVTTEVYPYTAASTLLQSAIFDPGWQERMGIGYGDLQWVATGSRLTKESFEVYRRERPGLVVVHMIPEEVADLAVARPGVLIASDGMPFLTGKEHPRGAGSFARVLGHYVREKGALSLDDAIAKMTLLPARRLEGFAPQMRHKGRIREGADADITVFDPLRVIDRASYEAPMQFSAGIEHVLVRGTFVVRDARLVEGVSPGQPVRAPLR